MSKHCLNCDTLLQGSYCHSCGQKSSTHRITFAKFIQHDLVHGLFHLDKGVLYTLKTLIYSPGYAARSFLAGKRVMHYNIFALFIIIIALKTLIDLQQSPGDEVFSSDVASDRHSDEIINHALKHYYKLLYLLVIPLFSAFSSLFLKKLRYNFVEHIVLNCFLLAGSFFYALIFSLFAYLIHSDLRIYALLFQVVYMLLGYYQVTRGAYSFFDFLWRGLSILALFFLALFLLFCGIIIVFYGGAFEGTIS